MLFILDLVLIFIFLLFFRTILYVSFDASFAQTQKIPVKSINLFLLSLMSISIVLCIRVVGIVLLISLFTIPPSTANLFANRFSRIIYWSILISLIGTIIGLIISYKVNIPSGAAIIVVLILIFGIVKLLTYILTFWKRNKSMQTN
jgi:zinc transport system permease protein